MFAQVVVWSVSLFFVFVHEILVQEHHSHVQRISNSDHYLSNGTDSHILDNESDLIHENRYHSMEVQ